MIQTCSISKHRWNPGGPNVIIIDVIERMGFHIQPQHSVVSGIICTIRDAVPLYQWVYPGMTSRTAALRLGMQMRKFAREYFQNVSVTAYKKVITYMIKKDKCRFVPLGS